jgi:hypothetical protein
MDKKVFMTAEDILIISTIEFSNNDIRCLEKWIVKKENIMMVTCPWNHHIRGKGRKVIPKFEKVYCHGKCHAIFSNSFKDNRCPCWVNDIQYVIEMVMHIIGSNRPWYDRLMRWLNGIIPM